MIKLPENKRRTVTVLNKKVIWVYGAPFTGKTFLANKFPDPLMLNTDGNVKFIDSPFYSIKDVITVEGRLTKRTLAWDLFSGMVGELEKKQNDFKTIVVDLLEDCYEHCRVWGCDKLGIDHEADNSFKAYDYVRSEFLRTIKRLINLDYENIILISHEDSSKDLTKRTGDKITRIAPNINEKVANKVAGMVDIVGRVVANGEDRILSFKTNEVIFGGGRLGVKNTEIPLEYKNLMEVYDGVKPKKTESKNKEKVKEKLVEEQVEEVKLADDPLEKVGTADKTPEKVEVETADDPPKRRRRKTPTENKKETE